MMRSHRSSDRDFANNSSRTINWSGAVLTGVCILVILLGMAALDYSMDQLSEEQQEQVIHAET